MTDPCWPDICCGEQRQRVRDYTGAPWRICVMCFEGEPGEAPAPLERVEAAHAVLKCMHLPRGTGAVRAPPRPCEW